MQKPTRSAFTSLCLFGLFGLFSLLSLTGLTGCTHSNAQIGPTISALHTLDDAQNTFGMPSKIQPRGDGSAVYTWRSQRYRELTPEEERIIKFGPPLGSSRANYRIPYVPFGSPPNPCEIKVTVDPLGNIISKSHQGQFCDSMIR